MLRAWAACLVALLALAASLAASGGGGDSLFFHRSYAVKLPLVDRTFTLTFDLARGTPPGAPPPADFFRAFYTRGRVYAVCAMCTPRLALAWARALDWHNTQSLFSPPQLGLLTSTPTYAPVTSSHDGGGGTPAGRGSFTRWLPSSPSVALLGFLTGAVAPDPAAQPAASLAAAAPPTGAPAATAADDKHKGDRLPASGRETGAAKGPASWLMTLLLPGLQVAYISLHYASTAPLKVFFYCMLGVAETLTETIAWYRLMGAAARRDWPAAGRCVVCCYILPAFLTLQAMVIAFWTCLVLPRVLVDLGIATFALWLPPVMLVLMAASWQPAADIGGAGGPEGDIIAAVRRVGLQVAAVAVGDVAAAGDGAASRVLGKPHWPPAHEIPEDLDDDEIRIPSHFLCPITRSVMRQPAVTPTGASYEASAILKWLAAHRRDPLTQAETPPERVAPNLNLHAAIGAWLEEAVLPTLRACLPAPVCSAPVAPDECQSSAAT